jgi:hypothetical protein
VLEQAAKRSTVQPVSQTRLGSWLEAWANIVIGFAINWSANMLVFPLFGFNITAGQAFNVGLIFTAISLVRSYVLRRFFNKIRRLHAPY